MFCIFKALIVEQEETANLLSLCLGNLLTCRILRSVTGSHYLEKKNTKMLKSMITLSREPP